MSGNLKSRKDLLNEHAWEKAEKLGLDVVLPDDDELFIDLDTPEANEQFHKRIEDIEQFVKTIYVIRPSQSGDPGRNHAYVKLQRPVQSQHERMLLQILLGSDPTRELLSWARTTVKQDAHPVLFFEQKGLGKPVYTTKFRTDDREVRFVD